jgi:arylsulfatase A-like enzyme
VKPLSALAAALCCGALAGGCGRAAPEPARSNVVLIVLDTVRADRLGAYGGPRPTTPNLDAFAAQGILFARARAPSPYTSTSHASLFASVDPEVHGVWNKMIEGGRTRYGDALSPNAATLAETLRDAGWQTAAVADGGNVSPETGLDQGFDLFDSRTNGAPERVDRALRWLEQERDPARPFFLFLHTYEAHIPYVPDAAEVARFAPGYSGPLRAAYERALAMAAADPAARKRQRIQLECYKPVVEGRELSQEDRDFYLALYDAEIALADREIGRFLAALDAAGLDEDTIVIVTSDHGEAFWEHGYHGHHHVFEELLRVPLIVRGPGAPRGARRNDDVGLLDLMPSLLGALGVPVPAAALGRDVGLLSAESAAPRDHFAAANYPLEQRAGVRGDRKWFVQLTQRPQEAVFDLADDPRETRNLLDSAEMAEFLRSMRAEFEARKTRLREHRERHGLAPVPYASTVGRAAELAALGYADD